MKSKWIKYIGAGIGALVAGIGLMLGATMLAYPAISQLVGLAVAQSSTLWNNVKDAAAGDGLSNGILVQSTYLFNGLTFDRVRGTGGAMNVNPIGAITPADAYVNPTTATQTWSLNGVFNGTTWDRMRSVTADAMASTGLVSAANQAFNGTTWDRIRTATADALASTGIQAINSVVFNGTTFDREDGISATNNTATTSVGTAYTTPLSTWTIINTTSASATAATASRAAGGGTVRHVATGLSICSFDSAQDLVVRLVHLRDGAAGAGIILKTFMFSTPVASGSRCEIITGLNMTGTGNTAMTLEFATAPAGATQSQTVSLQGYSTP